MFASKDLTFAKASGGYQISRSLRFRSSASAYLSRTPGTPTDNKKWTWSGWIKIGSLSQASAIISGGSTANDYMMFGYNITTANGFYFLQATGGTNNIIISSVASWRDPSAWYHWVIVYDSANATQANRFRFYVNGIEQTYTASTAITLNQASYINSNAQLQYIGTRGYSALPFDGYLAEVNFIDGQALTPSSFGAYDTNGVWQPSRYTGTYGTNGFYLPFSNTTSTTTLVADSSGNGNNWTPNNISLTSGTTYDSMIDSPTNYADGGNGRGNYATLNATTPATVSFPSGGSLINANLSLSVNANVYTGNNATIQLPSSGKWYWEGQCNQNSTASQVFSFGVASPTLSTFNINQQTGSGVYWWSFTNARYLNLNGTNTNTASTYTAGTVVMAAYDADTQKLYLGIGGTWYSAVNTTTTAPDASGNPVITTNLSGFYPAVGNYGSSNTVDINFGQRPFTYTPPSGFLALNTQNLPTPTIANGAQHMAATTYTGNGTSQSVTNSGLFQPDLVWCKNRSVVASHNLYDVVRGASQYLISDSTSAEGTASGVTAFNSNGFTVGSLSNVNGSGNSLVGWQWKAGGTGVSNTSGTITSTVSANVSAGFSVVNFTGVNTSGTTVTVGHGLGVAPSFIIIKNRDVVDGWYCYHAVLGNNAYIVLNTPAAQVTPTAVWATTSPSSTVFSLRGGSLNTTTSQNLIAYCFAPVAGYSAFGSYTGNGSTDGTFVYCGFRPRWVLMKRIDAGTENWFLFDTSRSSYNGGTNLVGLFPNLSDLESTGWGVDVLSNGFKLRLTANPNTNGGAYIYAAFAENPFKISRAR